MTYFFFYRNRTCGWRQWEAAVLMSMPQIENVNKNAAKQIMEQVQTKGGLSMKSISFSLVQIEECNEGSGQSVFRRSLYLFPLSISNFFYQFLL
jgi:hypothetical protein